MSVHHYLNTKQRAANGEHIRHDEIKSFTAGQRNSIWMTSLFSGLNESLEDWNRQMNADRSYSDISHNPEYTFRPKYTPDHKYTPDPEFTTYRGSTTRQRSTTDHKSTTDQSETFSIFGLPLVGWLPILALFGIMLDTFIKYLFSNTYLEYLSANEIAFILVMIVIAAISLALIYLFLKKLKKKKSNNSFTYKTIYLSILGVVFLFSSYFIVSFLFWSIEISREYRSQNAAGIIESTPLGMIKLLNKDYFSYSFH